MIFVIGMVRKPFLSIGVGVVIGISSLINSKIASILITLTGS